MNIYALASVWDQMRSSRGSLSIAAGSSVFVSAHGLTDPGVMPADVMGAAGGMPVDSMPSHGRSATGIGICR